MKTYRSARAALTFGALCLAALTLTACGGDPGQMTGDGASGGGSGILDLLVSKVLPLVLGGTGVGGALAGGIPVVLNLLRGMKASAAKAEIANDDSLLDAIFRRAPAAAQVGPDPRDGVDLLKGLFGPQIEKLGITDEALRLLVQSAKPPQG